MPGRIDDWGPIAMISVVVSADDGYAQHAGVALASVAMNMSDVSQLRCHVLDCGISAHNRQAFNDCAQSLGFELNIFTPSLEPLQNLPLKRYGPAAWGRLLIPDLLPDSRAIYLDCDVVVEADMAELWATDMEGKPIAAVGDGLSRTLLPIPSDNYFNSGVMLMDLELWRTRNITADLLDFAATNSELLKYPDQDTLNGVLRDNWLRLPPRWNATSAVFSPEMHATIASTTGYQASEIEEAFFFPAVIHYSSPRRRKPWMLRTYHPLAHRYWKYLAATPWKNYAPPDKNLLGMLHRYRRFKDIWKQARLRREIEERNPRLAD